MTGDRQRGGSGAAARRQGAPAWPRLRPLAAAICAEGALPAVAAFGSRPPLASVRPPVRASRRSAIRRGASAVAIVAAVFATRASSRVPVARGGRTRCRRYELYQLVSQAPDEERAGGGGSGLVSTRRPGRRVSGVPLTEDPNQVAVNVGPLVVVEKDLALEDRSGSMEEVVRQGAVHCPGRKLKGLQDVTQGSIAA